MGFFYDRMSLYENSYTTTRTILYQRKIQHDAGVFKSCFQDFFLVGSDDRVKRERKEIYIWQNERDILKELTINDAIVYIVSTRRGKNLIN